MKHNGHLFLRRGTRDFVLALAAIATVAMGIVAHPPAARAATGAKAGLLTCHSRPDSHVNWIVYSSVEMDCVFDTPGGQERYAGVSGVGLGVDLSWRPQTALRFVVLMAGSDVALGAHSLAGYYGGAKAAASIGVTAGASVLIGGGKKSISLEPLAVETGSGLGAAAGLSYLVLRPEQ